MVVELAPGGATSPVAATGTAPAQTPSGTPDGGGGAVVEHVLEVRGIRKTYGGVVAVDDVSFALRRGEMLALAGENGAGKSTVIGVMAGARRPDAGEVLVGGRPVQLQRPADARHLGIGVVYQEAQLVPHLSVADNVFLGREPRSRVLHRLRGRALRDAYTELRERTGIELDGQRPAAGLSVAERQLVQLLRVAALEAHIVILDEPTAALSPQDRTRMFELLARMRTEYGASCILVSHFLDELEAHCDRAVILRNGAVAGHLPERPVRARELSRLMARGRTLADSGPLPGQSAADRPVAGPVVVGPLAAAVPATSPGFTAEPDGTGPARTVLQVSGVRGLSEVPFDLTLRAGEVVGLAGLVGSGRTELLRAIGLNRGGGEVTVGGTRVRTPRQAVRAGLMLLPEDRRSGLLMDWSLWRNVSIASLSRSSAGPLLRPRAERARAAGYLQRLSVKAPSPDVAVGTLSGGNQQKVAFARVLAAEAPVALLDEPTHGIDVHTKAEILQIVRDLAAAGHAFVVVAAEFGDLLQVCTRVLTIHKGVAVADHDLRTATPSTDDLLFEAATGRPCSLEAR